MAQITDPWPKKSGQNGHPMDGTTLEVTMGDGAWASIPDPRSYGGAFDTHRGIGWHLTWGDYQAARLVAASLISSYDYLLSDNINMTEATRRLRLMRATRRQALSLRDDNR